LKYISTRGESSPVSSAEAIKMGIAPDGGLFVPHKQPKAGSLEALINLSYPELARTIMAPYLESFSEAQIAESAQKAYNPQKFAAPDIAPLHQADEKRHFLELWHGPTCAFKDMALQVLPHLLRAAMMNTNETADALVLTATSGDTGTAALEGFRDVPGTRIIVFYPEEGVSETQKRQMITQEGKNVHVIAVKGNFDDAQNGVKAIFSHQGVREKVNARGYNFSSANSINWGRLVPQIVYYFRAYLDICRRGLINAPTPINFVVPTGNFGNILAAYYAMQMGLPVNRLICAANSNNVLTEFINTGSYDRRKNFVRTISPSMDILISSNLERLLFELTEQDAAKTSRWMEDLKETGNYTIDSKTAHALQEIFWSDYADDAETMATIRSIFDKHNYLIDTHTAVATAVFKKYLSATGDDTHTVIISTASPFKFNRSVAQSLLERQQVEGKSDFELLQTLEEKTGLPVPPGLKNLETKPILHHSTVNKDSMAEAVLEALNED